MLIEKNDHSPVPYLELIHSLGIECPNKKMKPHSKVSSTQTPNSRAIIIESFRNNTLASIAGSMRRNGMELQAIEAALQQVNKTQCKPPLDCSEVSTIAASIASYAPANPGNILETLNDSGNAERFAKRWGDTTRYVHEWKKWLIWDGTRWVKDDKNIIVEMAKEVARDIFLEGVHIPDPSIRDQISRHSRKSSQEPRLSAMVSLAESIPMLVVSAADLDKNFDLLNVANGVIDLNTGKLHSTNPDDLITQKSLITFDSKAKCPAFIAFIEHIMGKDKQLINYIQRVIGYSLTGSTSEQCLFFLYGLGANGKSTLLNALNELLGGDYAKVTPSETLMAKNGGRSATNDLARLQSARAVIANEVEGGAQLAESMIKQITGGDPISARYLYAEYFEFKPVFKLFVAGNHKPVIRGDDNGIWRRIHLIPFEVTIAESDRDPNLTEKVIVQPKAKPQQEG